MIDKLSLVLELQEKGKTRREIWKEIGYSECSGLTKLMRSKGYEYNQVINKYEYVGQPSYTSKTSVKKVFNQEPLNVINKDLQSNLLTLANRYSEINQMLQWYKEQGGHEQDTRGTQIIEVINQGVHIDLPKVESVKTSVRVNREIWEQFGVFATTHSEFVKGDLICQALKEYMDKHNS